MKDLDLVKIFSSMKDNGISELIIKDGKTVYEVRRGGIKQNIVTSQSQPIVSSIPQNTAHVNPPVIQQQQSGSTQNTALKIEEKPAQTNESKGSNFYELKSPLVGTFYGASKPGAPNFVEVGDKVKKGQTLCIVEAMKNFNEIESEVNGTIREICVKNEELVEFGKVLFQIELD